MAKAVLSYLGEREDAESAGAAFEKYPRGLSVFRLVGEKQQIMKDAWLTTAGHKRPGMNVGLPLEEARKKEAGIDMEIRRELH